MSTIGCIQSNYLPWRGYFDFIKSCDVFVILDDVQYTARDWRNRNKIKTKEGTPWITVPVVFSRLNATTVANTPINDSMPWVEQHKNLLTYAYSKAPYFLNYSEDLFSLIEMPAKTISELNVRLIKWALEKLNIKTKIILSTELKSRNEKSLRLLDIVKQLDGTRYLSGPAAKDYLQIDLFNQAGIGVEFKKYGYPPYPQLSGEFQDYLSIVDLLFNVGPDSYKYLELDEKLSQ
jgi:hypothetical protein